MNTVTASVNTITGQTTEMSQRENTVWVRARHVQ